MSFLEVGVAPKTKPKKQRLYIMRIVLISGLTVIKIGKASGSSSKDRMLQICGSIFDKYRTTPGITIKRDQEVEVDAVFKYETILHQFFSNYQYIHPSIKFDGSTECFVIPLEDAIQAYEAVISGEVPDCQYVLPACPIDSGEDDLPF